MKLKVFLIGIVLISFIIPFILAEENAGSMIVRADVQAETISIDVNSSINFGTIAKGYKTDEQKIEIINRGNVGINVIPRLNESYTGGIFNYLFFQRILSDSLKQIGNFNISVDKPAILGGTEKQTMYVLLDLRNYSGNVNSAISGHNTNVIFWATKV